MTQIRSIRALQSLGLSLEEVKQYYYDSDELELNTSLLEVTLGFLCIVAFFRAKYLYVHYRHIYLCSFF